MNQNQNSFDPEGLPVGGMISVPLWCACPKQEQISQGVNYQMTHVVASGESVSQFSMRFGADIQCTPGYHNACSIAKRSLALNLRVLPRPRPLPQPQPQPGGLHPHPQPRGLGLRGLQLMHLLGSLLLLLLLLPLQVQEVRITLGYILFRWSSLCQFFLVLLGPWSLSCIHSAINAYRSTSSRTNRKIIYLLPKGGQWQILKFPARCKHDRL